MFFISWLCTDLDTESVLITPSLFSPTPNYWDNDGVDDTNDAFPLNALEGTDTDGDGIGNNADTDDDGDGVLDSFDAYPLDADNNQIKMFDIDGNGQFDALTDSLLIMRYGFGFSGDELIDDAVGEGATRTSVEEIEAYLEGLTPEL